MSILEKFFGQAQSDSIDKQIHTDVFSAQEALLEETRRVLSQPLPEIKEFNEDEIGRLERLKEMGFSSTKQVKRLEELKIERDKKEQEAEENRKIQEWVKHYNLHYPQHKFIDNNTVNKICNKYGLVLARVSDYIDDIPEKNQKEIVDFRIKKKDARCIERISHRGLGSRGGGKTTERFSKIPYIDPAEDEREKIERLAMGSFRTTRTFCEEGAMKASEEDMISGQSLQIIAPPNKIDMTGKEVHGNKVYDKVEIKDPIVLQPVAKGYLIITAWGFEAEDEDVVNPVKN